MSTPFQESNETWRRLRLQQILYKSVLNNDLDMVIKCVQHGADIREEYLPVSEAEWLCNVFSLIP